MLPQPLTQVDFYKVPHYRMYPSGMTSLYNNCTPRKSRIPSTNKIVFFGLQYAILKYIIEGWNKGFFELPFEDVKASYSRLVSCTLGPKAITYEHLEQLHDQGYMPLEIKALPEGSLVPVRVPMFTIRETEDHAAWLVNYLETIISCTTWQPCTSATLAHEFKKELIQGAYETADDLDFVMWQGHDFSMRGMSSFESACTSGAGHLLSFTGTDTFPAITFLEEYYGADVTKELVGGSVPATEHSVMCMGTKEGELETFERLLDLYPEGIISIVSDTWSMPHVLTVILPALKEKIMARNGKLVIRPDSFWTDPVDCLCGYDGFHPQMAKLNPAEMHTIRLGLIETLGELFGTTLNSKGYKVLDPHIGAIYGDAITKDRAADTTKRLKEKGYASTNVVYGIGSYTYQMNTRDTFGLIASPIK